MSVANLRFVLRIQVIHIVKQIIIVIIRSL